MECFSCCFKDPSNRPVAKKLLELPIFVSNTNTNKISLSGNRNHSSLDLSPHTSFTERNHSEARKPNPKTTKNDIHTYRSLNFHPIKVTRINGRFQPVKTF